MRSYWMGVGNRHRGSELYDLLSVDGTDEGKGGEITLALHLISNGFNWNQFGSLCM